MTDILKNHESLKKLGRNLGGSYIMMNRMTYSECKTDLKVTHNDVILVM